MKKFMLISLAILLSGLLFAADGRFVYPLVQVQDSDTQNIIAENDQVLVYNNRQLWIYSLFNPLQPRLEASYISTHKMEDVNLQGNSYIYVSSQEPSMSLNAVETLGQLGRIYFTNTLIGDKIRREGATLYVADRYRGIDIINVGRGGSNDFLGNFAEKWGIRDFDAEYPYLYALNDFGFAMIDVSDLSYPIGVSTYYQISDATMLVKDGDYVYIGAGQDLFVLSIRQLDKPTLISQYRLPNEIQAMKIKDKRLFMALGRGGVKILDIGTANQIRDINTFYPPGAAVDIELYNDYIFVAMGKDGWVIYEYK
ncbi:MAG: hypothetical protein LHW60_06550 [Candidatus Cloacimonetes bacterium]|nr:hypothetical protein [Candidatus Cloacimonadota bacterium]